MAVSALEKMRGKYGGPSTDIPQIAPIEKSIPPEPAVKQEDEGAFAVPSVLVLKKILESDHNLRIRATAKRTSLIYPVKSTNDAVLDRLYKLVFFDQDCWKFLHDHPEEIISGKNFLGR